MDQIFKIWRVQPLGPPQNMWKKGLKRSITSVWYIVSRLCDSITSVWVGPNWHCECRTQYSIFVYCSGHWWGRGGVGWVGVSNLLSCANTCNILIIVGRVGTDSNDSRWWYCHQIAIRNNQGLWCLKNNLCYSWVAS